MTKLHMNTEQPEQGDYVQLLDHETMNPCENFTYVDVWVSELGCQLFLISDFRGEHIAVTRNFDFDDGNRKGWVEVITAIA